jgi:hypothetical protein
MPRRAARLAEDELRRTALRVVAAIVVGTMIGRLGLDFIEALSLVLQCCRYGEAEVPDAASSEPAALLRPKNQAEFRIVPLVNGTTFWTLSSETGRMV